MWLVLASLLVSVLIAVPVGVLGAARQNSGLDTALSAVSIAGLSMPTFLLGLMLIIFLAVLPFQWHHNNGWNWLPYLPPGSVTGLDRENNFFDFVYHLILPATALAAVQIGVISRYVRFSMLEVLGENYIRTAFAKGVSTRRVLLKHALKNAILPLITTIALALPGVLSGLVIVEMIFAYPGLGQLFYFTVGGTFTGAQIPDAGSNREFMPYMDLPVALILFLIMLIVVALVNMLADLLYAASDPRLSFVSNTDR
jgi:peptide/nickel transport system permease protein